MVFYGPGLFPSPASRDSGWLFPELEEGLFTWAYHWNSLIIRDYSGVAFYAYRNRAEGAVEEASVTSSKLHWGRVQTTQFDWALSSLSLYFAPSGFRQLALPLSKQLYGRKCSLSLHPAQWLLPDLGLSSLYKTFYLYTLKKSQKLLLCNIWGYQICAVSQSKAE